MLKKGHNSQNYWWILPEIDFIYISVYKIWIKASIFLKYIKMNPFSYTQGTYMRMKGGNYSPTSKPPFKWHFAGGLIVSGDYFLAGIYIFTSKI